MTVNEKIQELQERLEPIRREISDLMDARKYPAGMVAGRIAELVQQKKVIEQEICQLNGARLRGVVEV